MFGSEYHKPVRNRSTTLIVVIVVIVVIVGPDALLTAFQLPLHAYRLPGKGNKVAETRFGC